MAYTLAQLAKLEKKSYLKKGIIMNMLRDSKFLEWLPWQGVDSLQSYGLRVRTLGTSGAFRKINGSYTEATDGDVEEVWESVYGFGGEVKFDRVYDKIKNVIIDPKQQQLEMKLKAMTLTFNDYVINGDHATDADGFEGLKKRIAGMPSRQTVALGDSAAYDPTAAAANGQYFLTKWEEAWYKCNKGQVNAIIMNESMYYGYARVLRFLNLSGGAGLLDTTKDSHDRTIVTYRGAPFVDIGLKKDQSTEIITNTETSLAAGSDTTSVYFASFGIENGGLGGIQLSDMEVYDPNNGAEMSTAPATQVRIEWWHGLCNLESYGLTRLYNLENPAAWT